MFEEVPFDVEIGGNRCSPIDGLKEVDAEVGPMVAKRYPMEPPNHWGGARMTLHRVSLRARSRWT
jgi:hypothetical protein